MFYRINRRIGFATIVLSVAALAGIGGRAGADPFDISYNWDGSFGGAFQGTISYVRNGKVVTDNPAYAGAFTATVNGTPPAGLPKSFHTYCVDLDHGQYVPGQDPYVHVSTSENAEPILKDNAGKMDVSGQLEKAAWLYEHYDGLVNGTTNAGKAEGVALQLAIWKVLEDTQYTPVDGNIFNDRTGITGIEGSFFAATGFVGNGYDALSIATGMLAQLGTNESENGVYLQVVNQNGKYDPNRYVNSGQNMIMSPGGPIKPDDTLVPEGNSFAMLSLGAAPLLLGVLRLRVRKRRRGATA